ncbi:response regulator transcription factor [Reyranella soli]|uniref:OmpR/PhoB-type domain-containing protein n=1 Tax=Reyranella soli TaxID=1230389 RepID=A0A512NMQ6_9HYPH|nr:response regulator transcription factor [Reyranella soli]GEP60231.1 hypothetical protein RSO01_73970 [Reyranella soli]
MPEIERHGDLALDRQAARALWQGQDVAMTEYKIVAVLVSHKGSLQTYRAIYDLAHYEGFVAGSGEHGHTTNVRSMVKRIRKKFLAVDPASWRSGTCATWATGGSILSTEPPGRQFADGCPGRLGLGRWPGFVESDPR